jgi:hypothetical protein
MRVREAKDFLVEQAAEQAVIEGVSLSDLEKRMMYFTESEDAVEDTTRLNQEFEAEFDTDKYERKISALLHHAYKRIQDSTAIVRQWDQALSDLCKCDHYISVLWNRKPPAERSPYDSLFLLVSAIAAIVVFFAFGGYVDRISRHLPRLPLPGWIAFRLFGLLLMLVYFGCRFIVRKLRSR